MVTGCLEIQSVLETNQTVTTTEIRILKSLKEKLTDGEVVFGGTVSEHLRPSVVKAFRNAGFDFIYIENEVRWQF